MFGDRSLHASPYLALRRKAAKLAAGPPVKLRVLTAATVSRAPQEWATGVLPWNAGRLSRDCQRRPGKEVTDNQDWRKNLVFKQRTHFVISDCVTIYFHPCSF